MTTQASTRPPGTRLRRSRVERLAGWGYSHRRRAVPAWVAVQVVFQAPGGLRAPAVRDGVALERA